MSFTPRAERALLALGGRGAVVATAHVGNWDLTACAVAERVRLLVVTKRLRVRALDAVWHALRARRGVHLVGAEGAIARAQEAVAGGALVAMLVDQAPVGRRGLVRYPFLGIDAFHDPAAALLAARSGQPLVVAFGHRRADGRHEVDVPAVFSPPARGRAAWARRTTEAVADELAGYVRAHPEQWLWLHRRWKTGGPPTRRAGRPRAPQRTMASRDAAW